MNQWSVHSPVGDLTISAEDDHVVALDWGRSPPDFQVKAAILSKAADWLDAYFDGHGKRWRERLSIQVEFYEALRWLWEASRL